MSQNFPAGKKNQKEILTSRFHHCRENYRQNKIRFFGHLGNQNSQEQYKILKKEPLLFDYEYLKELSNIYAFRKKKHKMIAVPCTILFIVGIIILALTSKGYFVWSEYHSFVFLGFAVGLFGFVYSCGVMEAYELLTGNEEYTSRLFFKLRRKMKEKLDRL